MTSLVPNEAIALLRQLQKTIKETGQLIHSSPWADHGSSGQPNGISNGSYASLGVQSPVSQIPMTPASAALGPAVQATVPSTPQSASYNALFSNNWVERADALLSMTSANSYRSATMSSTVGSHDMSMGSSSIISPMSSMTSMNLRYNGTGKVAF